MSRKLTVAAVLITIVMFKAPTATAQSTCALRNSIVNMNFDAVPLVAANSTSAVPYLNSYGVSFTAITPSSQAVIYNVTGQTSTASSPPNAFFVTPTPTPGPVSYRLDFCAPLKSISFTRAAVDACCRFPAWRVRAFDGNGVEVASVNEPTSVGNGTSRRFSLAGDIRSIVFDANNSNNEFNHPPFDDFVLDAGVADTKSGAHVFPQIVDGAFPDGTVYRSTFLVSSDNGSATDCTTTLVGLTIPGFGDGTTNTFSLPAGGWSIVRTPGTQPLKTGYAVLNCSAPVAAEVLYSANSSTGALLAEATVFSSPNATMAQLLADHRNGAQLGVAIANTSNAAVEIVIRALDSNETQVGQATVQLPAKGQVAKFLFELLTLPPGFVGRVLISTNPANVGNIYAIGLRLTGYVMTTIPVVLRTP